VVKKRSVLSLKTQYAAKADAACCEDRCSVLRKPMQHYVFLGLSCSAFCGYHAYV